MTRPTRARFTDLVAAEWIKLWSLRSTPWTLGLSVPAVIASTAVSVRALIASALLAPVCALVGLGLGVLVRHSATTMVTAAFLLLMLPMVFSSSERWSAELSHLTLGLAWDRLTTDWMPPAGPSYFPATVTDSWIVLAAWPVALLLPALVTVRHRDA